MAEFPRTLELSRGALIPLAGLGYVQAGTGNRAEAVKALERLREQSKQRYIPAYYFAIVYAVLGRKDQAFGWPEKASVKLSSLPEVR